MFTSEASPFLYKPSLTPWLLLFAANLKGLTDLMLTHRRYIETVDLIYRTNTIHVSSLDLSRNIHHVLLPNRLLNISSMELIWDLISADWGEVALRAPSKLWSNYNRLLDELSTFLPSLTTLHLSVAVSTYIAGAEFADIDMYTSQMLESADRFLRRYETRLQNFQLAPNLSLYNFLLRSAELGGALVEKADREHGFKGRFRRPVHFKHDGAKDEYLGYWIRPGKDDTPVW